MNYSLKEIIMYIKLLKIIFCGEIGKMSVTSHIINFPTTHLIQNIILKILNLNSNIYTNNINSILILLDDF